MLRTKLVLLFFAMNVHCVFAQSFPPVTGLDVAVELHCDDDLALSQGFVDGLREHVELVLSTMLGGGAKVKIESTPAIADWLSEHDLAELTPANCQTLGCDKSEKTILIDVQYRSGCFSLSATEFDRHFDSRGPIYEAEIVQRNMVRESAARLAMNCWTPIGRIQSKRDREMVISFANMARLLSVPNWSRMKKGAVLQLYRETINGNQLRQDAHPTQFLTIKTVSPSGAVAVPVGNEWDENWFQYVDDSRARYLVRRVAVREGLSRVKVLISGTVKDKPNVLVPRGGCDVYLHDKQPSTTQFIQNAIAVTNREGEAAFRVDSPQPVFLTVAYENQSITQPYVPGVSPEPVMFQFRYLGNQSDYLTRLAALHDKLRASSAVINSRIQQITDTAKDADVATIQRLGQEALKRANVDALIEQVDEIEKLAKAESLDISKEIASFRRSAQNLTQQTSKLQSEMLTAESFAAGERALESIQGHFDAMRWDEVLSEMSAFSQKYPDHPQATKLTAIRSAIEPQNAEHGAARQTLIRAGKASDFNALKGQWSQIRDALLLLLQHDDSVYLTSVNAMRDGWMRLVNEEINSIKADNVAANKLQGQARDDEVAALKARVAALKPVRDDLEQLGPKILESAKKAKELLGDVAKP